MNRQQQKYVVTIMLMFLFIWLGSRAPAINAEPGSTVPLIVQGQVTLQRPNAPAPDPSWVIPLTVAFYAPGSSTKAYSWNINTNDDGSFSIIDTINPGQYDVSVKNRHTLRNRKPNVSIQAGTNAIDLGILREGDANNDNRVNVQDFTVLRSAYFTEAGQPAFDPRTDFDEDQRVNIRDFALLRNNYFSEGDIILPRLVASAPSTGVQLTLWPPVVRTEVGITTLITLSLHTDNQAIVGADVTLDFDPAFIQVVDANGAITQTVASGGVFDTVLVNRVNNTTGRIIFGAGTLSMPVIGTFPLFSFFVQAQAETISTTLAITDNNVVNPEGYSLPVQQHDGRIEAGAFPHLYLPVTGNAWTTQRFIYSIHCPVVMSR